MSHRRRPVIVFALPLHGHMPAMLLLSAELSARGQNVVCYTSNSFAVAVKDHGAAYRGYPSPLLDNLTYTPDFCWRLMSCGQSLLRTELDRLRADEPECVIYDAMLPWGPAVRDLLGVPGVSVSANLVFHEPVRRMMRHSQVTPSSILDLMAGCHARANAGIIAQELKSEFGVTINGVSGCPFPDDSLNIVFTSRLLQPFADSLDERYLFAGPALPRPEPARSPALEHPGTKPLVFLSFGTIFNTDRALFELCFEAFRLLHCDAVASTGRRFTSSAFPDAAHVRILPYVDQACVLQRASAAVTHGGMNTVCECLSHSVPVIVLPATEEQEVLARRLEELGCGFHIPRQQASPDTVAAAFQRVMLDPGYRERCRLIGQSLADGGGAPAAASRIQAGTALP